MIYIILLLLSFSLTYLIKNYAIKKALVDIPNERSSHTTPIPHGGGIAIAVTWFLGISYQFYTHEINSSLYYALMVGVVISVVSYFDDLYELSAKLRLGVQFSVATGGLFFLGGFSSLDFGLFSIENQFLLNLFAMVMIVWFINLYNFLDGINGYAGGEALFLALGGFLLFGGGHFLVLAAAVLGFLYWNWGKAKIFMGDVGSTLLGYNIAIFTIYYTNENPSNFWIWIILFALFWFDTTVTLIRRKLNGEQLSLAHKKHAYQRLVQSGWSHAKVSTLGMALNLVLFLLIFFIPSILISLIMAFVLLSSVMIYVDKQKGFS